MLKSGCLTVRLARGKGDYGPVMEGVTLRINDSPAALLLLRTKKTGSLLLPVGYVASETG